MTTTTDLTAMRDSAEVLWITGQALDGLATIEDDSVDLVTCSPPFLALRNYNDLPDQWGAEPNPAAFLANLLALVPEIERILAPHGSIAIELGDSYSGSGGSGGDYTEGGFRAGQAIFSGTAAKRARLDGPARPARNGRGPDNGWPLDKSLCGIPTLFAWSLAYGRNLLLSPPSAESALDDIDALTANGMALDAAVEIVRSHVGRAGGHPQTFDPWRIRNVIAWARDNPPTGSLGDKYRPAVSYITVATKSKTRWFDIDEVRVYKHRRASRGYDVGLGRTTPENLRRSDVGPNDKTWEPGSPPLDYWTDTDDGDLLIVANTQPSRLDHFAMWPPKLADRLILSMCPREVCRQCGEPRQPIKATEPSSIDPETRSESVDHLGAGPTGQRHDETRQSTTTGYTDCGHDNYRRGRVVDMFCGAGTTLAAAEARGRDSIGIDLDPDNIELWPPRRGEVRRSILGLKPKPPAVKIHDKQGTLL